MDKKIMIGMFSVLVLAVFVAGMTIGNGNVTSNSAGDGLNYGSSVCVYKNDELVGDKCQENTVVENGFDAVKLALGTAAGFTSVTELALGNLEAPALADTALAGIYGDSGLERHDGVYNTNGVGNWSIAYTWTCTATDKLVNTTALYQDAAGDLFAGTDFTATTLQSGDSLKVNYTLWVS